MTGGRAVDPTPPQTPDGGPARALPLSFGRFSVLWAGQFVSSVGSGLTAFGLAAYLFERTGAATSVTLVTLCAFLPPVLLAPVAGMLADRFDRRLLMIAGDGLSVFGLVFILAAALAGTAEPWQIYAGVLFSALFASLLDPAYRATITDLVPEEQYSQASGMVQLAGSAKYLISPFSAGFLYPWCGIEGLLAIDIATFAITVATTLVARRPGGARPGGRTGAEDTARAGQTVAFAPGWRALTAQPGTVALVAILAVATFCVGFLETLFPPMLLSFSTPQTLGVIETTAATGMLAGSLVLSVIKITRRHTRALLIGLGAAGVCVIGVGLTPDTVVIAAFGFCFFAALPFVNTPAEVLIRSAIPNQAQGRAWGLVSLLTNSGYVIAYAAAGPLADCLFTPALLPGGPLAGILGPVFGTGPGRGIGVMIAFVGFFLAVTALALTRSRSLATLAPPRPDKDDCQ
ncbi:MAG: MFS transporter [Propionibacteriaceae bacterium]|nr:MFS transporter [Propionibacteriaceae bacterium]